MFVNYFSALTAVYWVPGAMPSAGFLGEAMKRKKI